MDSVSTVLVPIDFSDYSRYALEVAGDFCRESNAALTILHVEAEGGSERAILDSIRSESFLDGLQVSVIVKSGKAVSCILDAIKETDCELVVMGRSGKGKNPLLGSTSERVLSSTEVPVLIVHERVKEFHPGRILVISNFYREFDVAFEKVKPIISVYPAQLELGKVITKENFESTGASKQSIRDFETSLGIRSEKVNLFNHKSLEQGMKDMIQESRPDLLVIGTHKRTGFKRILSGTRKKLTESLGVPVLCVRIPADSLNDRIHFPGL